MKNVLRHLRIFSRFCHLSCFYFRDGDHDDPLSSENSNNFDEIDNIGQVWKPNHVDNLSPFSNYLLTRGAYSRTIDRFMKRTKEIMEKTGERLVISIPSIDMKRDMMRAAHWDDAKQYMNRMGKRGGLEIIIKRL